MSSWANRCADLEEVETDVFIAGTGPVGAFLAKKVLDDSSKNARVLMVDPGAAFSPVAGAALKNAAFYQRDVDPFANVIRGMAHKLSVPPSRDPVATLGPFAYRVPEDKIGTYRVTNQNPDQDPWVNLPEAAATYAVGGMATHWTASCPSAHPTLERSDIYDNAEWDALYDEVKKAFSVNQHAFDLKQKADGSFSGSMRHELVKTILEEAYPSLMRTPYKPQSLPLAVRRRGDNDQFVEWTSTGTILGEYADPDGRFGSPLIDPAANVSAAMKDKRFGIAAQTICREFVWKENANGEKKITHAIVENLLHKKVYKVKARQFVASCGTVLSAQLLWASNIRHELLGTHMTEQPLAFCQVVLSEEVIERARKDKRFQQVIVQHAKRDPDDPLPFPVEDADPQCWIPVSEGRPWHCQIHRDAFTYGDAAPNVDKRLIVDLRWFGLVPQRKENKVTFSESREDVFGMPQPTFHFEMDEATQKTQHEMMTDMTYCASKLGAYLPGSNPQFMAPGLTLHIHGVTRMGKTKQDSVVDRNGKVWDTDNLYVAGLGTIHGQLACNPTITAACIALNSAEKGILPSL